ncbi:MAG: histidine kinase [Desulfovibrio sp.]|jgi:signal transduction histidine kinase|nr:histidine kinase [Desulfovibrio sp.]
MNANGLDKGEGVGGRVPCGPVKHDVPPENIVNLLPCYVILVDADHRILAHNAAFEKFFGPPDGRPCYAAMRGLDKPCAFCPYLQDGKKNRMSNAEWVHPQSGRAFRVHAVPFVHSDGTPCVLKTGFNITSDLRMQQALDLSEQSYRAITDNLSIGIALLDTSLRIKAGNIRLSQWFGGLFRLDARVCTILKCGSEYERAVREEKFYCPECLFRASLLDGAGHEKEYGLGLGGTDNERMIRLVTCPVKPGRGERRQVKALIMMLEDITGRLQVNMQLQRARKLAAMNTLAGGIAHEINQPLSALHLYAGGLQMLLEKDSDLAPSILRERLGLIMHEADKIRNIIANMRAMVKLESPLPLQPVSLPKVVGGVLAMMKHRTTLKKVHVHVDMPASLPPVLCNEVQLEQVLVNLLSNAMHALDSMGESGCGRRNILIRAVPLPGTRKVRLEVADGGVGLSADNERIFDPFYTTRDGSGGMGLGLSIVHGLVDLWGGAIRAVAHHEQLGGAAFLLDLPATGEMRNPEDDSEVARRRAVRPRRPVGADGAQ